jgi:hypothetical protein
LSQKIFSKNAEILNKNAQCAVWKCPTPFFDIFFHYINGYVFQHEKYHIFTKSAQYLVCTFFILRGM